LFPFGLEFSTFTFIQRLLTPSHGNGPQMGFFPVFLIREESLELVREERWFLIREEPQSWSGRRTCRRFSQGGAARKERSHRRDQPPGRRRDRERKGKWNLESQPNRLLLSSLTQIREVPDYE
jgi:hypothetical protein